MAELDFVVYIILCVVLTSPNLYKVFRLVTCHCFSSLGQKDTKDTQTSIYEKGDTIGKEARTAEVTVVDYSFMPSEESNNTLSVESVDAIATLYDTVDQECIRYSESG